MPAGMIVYFDDGVFQLDAEVRVSTMALKLAYSGPFTTVTGAFMGTLYEFDITVPSNVKSIFFSSSVQNSFALYSRVGTTWRFRCAVQAAFEVFGFADQNITPTNFGLQLYSSSGVLTFDAGAPWLRISDIRRSAVSGTTAPWPVAGRKYAAGLGNFPKRYDGAAQAGLPFWILRSYLVSVGPTQAAVGEGPIASRLIGGGGTAPPPQGPSMQPPTLMVVDVTNY